MLRAALLLGLFVAAAAQCSSNPSITCSVGEGGDPCDASSMHCGKKYCCCRSSGTFCTLDCCGKACGETKVDIYDESTCGDPEPDPEPEPSPCFPSWATVQRADGEIVPVSSLSAGDSILAAAADGTLGLDTVSSFSLADPSAKAGFLSISTASSTVTLTPTHKLPAGPAKELKQASEIAVGETIWLAAAGALVQEPVLKITNVVADGLHSPLTKHGGWPVVDGVATSYNSAVVVARNKYLVPLVEAACPSLGRLVVAAANPKAMHYIDGEVVEPFSSLIAAAVAITAFATLGARKLEARLK